MLRTLCFHLLSRCNLRCEHCWSNSGPDQSDAIRSESVVAFASALREHGLSHVSLSGGEPLLYAGLSGPVQQLIGLGVDVSVTTNGTLHRRLLSFLDTLPSLPSEQSGKVRIRVSLDGPRSEHDKLRGYGTYARALAGAGIVSSYGICPLAANVALGWDTQTVEGNQQWTRFLDELLTVGISDVAIIPIAPRGRGSRIAMETARAERSAERALSAALQAGFNAEIWSYLQSDHAYCLVEADGSVRLPGVRESDDLILGKIEEISPDVVLEAVNRQLSSGVGTFLYEHRDMNR